MKILKPEASSRRFTYLRVAMFPFIIKGKVPLGMRREYHLSESGLEDRISERLIENPRRSRVRTDGSPSGDGRGLMAEGLSRLRSMGLFTAVRVRRIHILSRKDHLFAAYEMDATVPTLVNMVLIPLVLGSILFSHSSFGFYESLVILMLLVAASWGLDVFVLVMLLRHEIYQVASEIRTILKRYDVPKIDPHHEDLTPEELLKTAYYYERNGLIGRCEAYLVHLDKNHPDSFEAVLAREHMETLEGIPDVSITGRTREGERREQASRGAKSLRTKGVLSPAPPCGESGNQQRDGSGRRQGGEGDGRRWFRMPSLLRQNTSSAKERRESRMSNQGEPAAERNRKRRFFGKNRRETVQERVVRKRRERLERRDAFARAPRETELSRGARLKLGLSRVLLGESREERRYRREQERWIHGPAAPSPPEQARKRGPWRPSWARTREERQALERQKRWLEGQSGPGQIQRSRDRWSRWKLSGGRGRAERQMLERRERAVEESTFS